MSTNLTEWLKYELYPSLFNSIDTVFNEHNFTRFPGGWRSNTYLHGGKKHKERKDKTVISKQAPGRIFEQGGDNLSLVDYVMKSKGIDFITACRTLAQAVNMELPKGDLSEGDYTKYKDRLNVLEASNDYFIYCLENSPGAKEVREYLQGRGYSEQDVKDMGLGFIPSQEQLKKKLKDKFTEAQIEEALQLNKAIGDTHRLTIPYRSGGTLKGFKFRNLEPIGIRYLNTTGLDKIGGFFNLSGLKGDKDIKIVEGELDSLHATVKGVENVVALGGDSISPEQIRNAIKMGAKSFTICLDTEPGKELQTVTKVKKVVEALLEEGVKRIYVATLPDLEGGKTDPDRLIKEQGVGAFKDVIYFARPYYYCYLDSYLDSYLANKEDRPSQRQTDQLLEEIESIGAKITEPLDKAHFTKYVTNIPDLKAWGVTEEALNITIDKVKATKDREAQKEKIKELLSKANKELTNGDQEGALKLLEEVRDIKLIDKEANYSKLLVPLTEETFREAIGNRPDNINTSFIIGGEPLVIPSKAISVIAGPTSHGKTTFLINLALDVLNKHPEKEVYFFSYEEDRDSIIIKALNSYLNRELSGNNITTITNYYKGLNSKQIDTKPFFEKYINTGKLNIQYQNYDTEELFNAIRYIHKNANPGAIFIDYIQLLNLPSGKYKTYSRQEEMKNICGELNKVAQETGLPIIVGAQFNREVTNHYRIHATKLGEAGDIERIANLILGFWNNNFKPLTATEGELNEINGKGIYKPNTLYNIILKNRGGQVGKEGLLSFNGNLGKIDNTEQGGW
jgi:DNA primase